jgi:hypothetical protein
MGTRNLTMVVKGGKFKVAQYGQWDGYPSGNGLIVLNFLKTVDLNEFGKKVAALRWLTKKEIKDVDNTPDWPKVYPYLSRDAGAKVLSMIMTHEGANKLVNMVSFAGDSLFCEWAYLIDLDNNTLEVYEGSNKTPITEGRFKSDDKKLDHDDSNVYHPIMLVKTYCLNDLPTDEEFLAELEPKEDDE